MTTADVIAHWRKGARDALGAAVLLEQDGKQELALFHCHLAVEKALKAAVVERTGTRMPPRSVAEVAAALSTLWAAVRVLGYTFKKVAPAAERDRPDVRAARAAWRDGTAPALARPGSCSWARRPRTRRWTGGTGMRPAAGRSSVPSRMGATRA